MSESKHTPGPWQILGETASYINVVGPDQDASGLPTARPGEIAVMRVCRVHQHCPGTANARLIAAAPDLLEALKGLVRYAEAVRLYAGMNKYQLGRLEAAKAAIRAAEEGK